MKKFINITEDASIYQSFPKINTGLDEILEVGKTVKWVEGQDRYTSASVRFLINFDLAELAQYPSASYKLSLKLANAKEVNRYQKLNAYLLTSPWVEGSGYFYQDVQNVQDGVSWEMADKDTNWSTSGSDFATIVSASATLSEYPLSDVTMDITELMAGPLFSGVPWYGIVVKFDNVAEADARNVGNIKFFSGNTHTIFSPKIVINQEDSQFITGSLKPIPNSSVNISPRNLKQAYTVGEVDKIYLSVRDKYPDKKFDAVQRYKSVYYLPSESYFRIKDESAGITLYDFNQFSKINCDLTGSYILLDTSGFEVNRYYTIDLKIKKDNLVFFPEFEYTFTVDRNG